MKGAIPFFGVGFILLLLVVPGIEAQSEWENPVKKTLREGKPVVAATITVASPDVAVQAASLGFDFLWIEMEHSPITLETARSMILATRGLKAVPFIRVPVNESDCQAGAGCGGIRGDFPLYQHA